MFSCAEKPWVFAFELKFYPPDPTLLHEEVTRCNYKFSITIIIIFVLLTFDSYTYSIASNVLNNYHWLLKPVVPVTKKQRVNKILKSILWLHASLVGGLLILICGRWWHWWYWLLSDAGWVNGLNSNDFAEPYVCVSASCYI